MPQLEDMTANPRKRCKARTTDVQKGEAGRCDRRKNHEGPHMTDNSAYVLAWFDGTFVIESI